MKTCQLWIAPVGGRNSSSIRRKPRRCSWSFRICWTYANDC